MKLIKKIMLKFDLEYKIDSLSEKDSMFECISIIDSELGKNYVDAKKLVSMVKDDNFICLNEENRIDAENKIKSTVGCGYEITSLTLSPLPLKNPTKNCKRYKINGTILIEQLSK